MFLAYVVRNVYLSFGIDKHREGFQKRNGGKKSGQVGQGMCEIGRFLVRWGKEKWKRSKEERRVERAVEF